MQQKQANAAATAGVAPAPVASANVFISLSERIANSARKHADDHAISIDTLTLTWAELDRQMNRVASRLAACGIVAGDRVATLGPNSPEYLILFLGALRAGACMVPLPTMASPDSLARMVQDAEARALFVAAPQRQTIEGIRPQLQTLLPGLVVGFDFGGTGWTDWTLWLAGASDTAFPDRVAPDDAFNIMYSSGTTGEPKGIVHSHQMRNEHIMRMARFGIGPGSPR